jgi:hypothetical protein
MATKKRSSRRSSRASRRSRPAKRRYGNGWWPFGGEKDSDEDKRLHEGVRVRYYIPARHGGRVPKIRSGVRLGKHHVHGHPAVDKTGVITEKHKQESPYPTVYTVRFDDGTVKDRLSAEALTPL